MGYGKLVDCGKSQNIYLKNLNQPMKKSSLIFDPNLFNQNQNISNNNQPSQVQVQQNSSQLSQNINSSPGESIQINQKNQERICRQVEKIQKKQQIVNIVKVNLLRSNVQIYTPDYNLRKHVLLPVKIMLPNFRETLIVQIELNKSLQQLKNIIFQQLELNTIYYYNFRLLSTCPSFCEFSVLTKPIYDCNLSQTSNVVLIASHAFCFQKIPRQFTENYYLSNNNNVLTGFKSSKVQKIQQCEQQVKKNSLKYIQVGCDTIFNTGQHYWQIKIDKYQENMQDFLVGVNQEKGTISWVLYPFISKIQIRKADSKQIVIKKIKNIFYKGDIIGLYLRFNNKKGKLMFYRNNACTDLKFQQINQGVKPFVGIGENCQISLDSKVLPPLDIQRFK